MRKRLILLAGLLAAALVVLGAFLASTISPEKLRALLDAELEARLGRPVELGRVSPSLFPPGARLRGLRVRDPSGGPDLARAERVSLRVRLWPLLRGEVRLAKLSVSKPEIRLVRDREGHLNIEDLLRGAREEAPPRRVPSPPTPPPLPGRRSTGRREGAPSPGPPAPPGGGGVLPFFFVRQLTLSDGVVVFEDQLQRERSLRLDSVDLSLRGRSLAGPFELTLSARLFPGIDRLPRLKASQLQVQGEVEPRAGAPPLVRGELRLASLPLGLFRHWLPRVDLFVSGGSLSLLAHVRSDGESLEGEGELTLEGSVLKAGGRAGARLPPTAFSFRGGAGPGGLSLTHWSVQSGKELEARGSLRQERHEGRARWRLRLEKLKAKLPQASAPIPPGLLPAKIESLARGGLKGELEVRKAAVQWEELRPPSGQGWSATLSGALRLRARELAWEGLPSPLRDQQLDLELEGELSPAAWRCLRCRASLGGLLSLEGSFVRDASSRGARWHLALRSGKADLGKLRALLPRQALPPLLQTLAAGGLEKGAIRIRKLEASLREDDPTAFFRSEGPLPWRGRLLLGGLAFRAGENLALLQTEPAEVRLKPAGADLSGGRFRLGSLQLVVRKGSWRAGRKGGFKIELGYGGPLAGLRAALLHPALPEDFRAYIRPTSVGDGETVGELTLTLPREKKASPTSRGTLRLKGANLRLRPGFPPLRGVSGEVGWEAKSLTLRALRGRLGASRVERFSLRLPLAPEGAPLALSLRGELTLPDLQAVLLAPEWPARVREWAERAERPEGLLRLELSASGGRRLKIEGAAEANGAALGLRGWKKTLRIPSGSASLRGGTLRLERVRALWGKDEATLSGEVSQPFAQSRRGSLRAQGSLSVSGLAELVERAGVLGVRGRGPVGFEAEVRLRGEGGSGRAELDLTRARYSYLALLRKRRGVEQRVSLAGRWRADAPWELSRLGLTLGRSRLAAEGLLRVGEGARVDLTLREGLLHLRDLASLLVLRELASARGEVALDLHARGTSLSDLALEGVVELRGVRGRSLFLARPLKELSGQVRLGASEIVLEGVRVRLPGFSAQLTGAFRGFRERATYERVRVVAGHIYRLLPGLESPSLEKLAEREDALRLLHASELRGRFAHREGRFLRWAYGGLGAEFSLQEGVLHLHALEAKAYGGRVRASGWMNALEVKSLPISLRFEAEGVDLGAFLKDAGAREHELTGKLNTRGELRSRYPSFAEFRKKLTGRLSFRARDGSINRLVALSKALILLDLTNIFKGKFSALAKRGIPYDVLKADFEVKDGVAHTENFLIDGPAMKVTAAGEVDLARGRYDLKVALAPLRTVDAVVSRVPLLGWVLTGKEKTLLVSTYEVKGPWEDPRVKPIYLRTLGRGILGVLERTLKLPGRILGGKGGE